MHFRVPTNVVCNNEEKAKVSIEKTDIIVKHEKCPLCGNNIEGNKVCSSHSIPKFILENLQNKGRILTLNSLINNDYLGKNDTGKSNALLFYSICKSCDNIVFSLYEKREIYDKMFSTSDVPQKLLYLIKLKNILFWDYKNKYDRELGKRYCRNINIAIRNNDNVSENLYRLQHIRYRMYLNEIDVKKIGAALTDIISNKTLKFKIGFFLRLNYNIEFALQRDICILHDTKWNIINDTADGKNLEYASFVIFPCGKYSIVMIFVDEHVTKYDDLFKQLSSMSIKEQLKWITFYAVTMTEDIVFANTLTVKNRKSLSALAANIDIADYGNFNSRIIDLKKIFNTNFYYFYKKDSFN